MGLDRRGFLKHLSGIGSAAVLGSTTKALANKELPGYPARNGVLVDLTVCIGCRKCEWACNETNKLPNRPIQEFDDKSVFDNKRRTTINSYTVVNRFPNSQISEKPVYVKKQCMHCDEPACASACFVKAFIKTPEGAVKHDPTVCIGCRYCMAACPFNIPSYEYDDAFTPEVKKCTFCLNTIRETGGRPACVQHCPVDALSFGRRSELVELAHDRLQLNPDRYINHVYGEHEVGGTSWMYISPVPFEEIGFRTDLGKTPIPQYSRGFLSVVSVVLVTWPALCIGFYNFSKRREELTKAESQTKKEE